MASAANKPVTCAGANTISGGGTPKPKSRTLDSSDTSDYENLSSCTSGRYATLPPQPQFGEGAKGNNGQYRDHYSTATTASAGVLFRPAGGAVGSFADNANEQFPSGDPPHTLSLHRPIKRSHWLNHNGRQSDVLARVFQANQDWLESNDGQDTVATTTSSAGNITIKDARSSHRTRSAQLSVRSFVSFWLDSPFLCSPRFVINMIASTFLCAYLSKDESWNCKVGCKHERLQFFPFEFKEGGNQSRRYSCALMEELLMA